MPRRRIPRAAPVPLRVASQSTERKSDGLWVVKATQGNLEKEYRCPGCSQPIARGLAHLVIWPEQKALLSEAAIDERRHWHKPCWNRRY